MPGTISFRPIEANLSHDTNWLGKMDPYCMFTLGTQRAKSQICKHGGTRPHWEDVVTLQAEALPPVVRLDVIDKDKFRPDDSIASADIDLTELRTLGSVSKWYPVYHRKKLAGEILLEATYNPGQPIIYQQPIITQPLIPTTTIVENTTVLPTTLNQGVPLESFGQQQFIGQSYEVPLTTNLGGFDNQLQGGLPLNQGFNTLQQGELLQGQNIGLIDNQFQSGLPLNQNLGGLQQGEFAQGPYLGLASKTSAFGPQGGFPHGNKLLKGMTNAGYSERPGYTLGTVESNPTCQSNLDTNGGGFFNKPGRERRAEPYTISNPGTYGFPHGDTVSTTGHIIPNAQLERPAPIGQLNQPGITGYPDGFNHGAGAIPPQNLNRDSFPTRTAYPRD